MGLLKVILHSKGYYIFKFQSTEDRDGVLASGPWHFASKGIVLQPWQEGVEFAKADCDKFPIWVKLSNIPLSYWSAEGISYIASGIGKPLCTDELTSKFELLNFARVCIEVNASFSFPSSINVTVLNSETLKDTIVPIEVEYQSKPPSCPTCKVFGHSPLKCPKTNYQWIPKVKAAEEPILPNSHSSSPPDFSVPPIVENRIQDLPRECDPNTSDKDDGAVNDWVTVSRGVKAGSPSVPNSLMVDSNSFSPIASSGDILLSPCSASPDTNPLVAKLRVIDEKEGKEMKHKQKARNENPQAAKKRKGKGKLDHSSS